MTYLHPFPPPARKDVPKLGSAEQKGRGYQTYVSKTNIFKLGEVTYLVGTECPEFVSFGGSAQSNYKTSEVESPGTCAQTSAQAEILADSPETVIAEASESKPSAFDIALNELCEVVRKQAHGWNGTTR